MLNPFSITINKMDRFFLNIPHGQEQCGRYKVSLRVKLGFKGVVEILSFFSFPEGLGWPCLSGHSRGLNTDIHKRYQTSYITLCNGASSTMLGLNLGVFRFLPTTLAKVNAKQIRSRSVCAAQHFMHVCLHAQTAVHAGNIRTWRTTISLITGKTRRPPNWASYRDKNCAGGIYICGVQT